MDGPSEFTAGRSVVAAVQPRLMKRQERQGEYADGDLAHPARLLEGAPVSARNRSNEPWGRGALPIRSRVSARNRSNRPPGGYRCPRYVRESRRGSIDQATRGGGVLPRHDASR